MHVYSWACALNQLCMYVNLTMYILTYVSTVRTHMYVILCSCTVCICTYTPKLQCTHAYVHSYSHSCVCTYIHMYNMYAHTYVYNMCDLHVQSSHYINLPIVLSLLNGFIYMYILTGRQEFEWSSYLKEQDAEAAPKSSFQKVTKQDTHKIHIRTG